MRTNLPLLPLLVLGLGSAGLGQGYNIAIRCEYGICTQPLIGFPEWSPELHVRILLRPDTGDKVFRSFDFVPMDPTNPRTAIRLLTGGAVPASIREKTLGYEPPSWRKLGTTTRTIEEVRGFCKKYDNQLRLLPPFNTCWTFADSLVAFLASKK